METKKSLESFVHKEFPNETEFHKYLTYTIQLRLTDRAPPTCATAAPPPDAPPHAARPTTTTAMAMTPSIEMQRVTLDIRHRPSKDLVDPVRFTYGHSGHGRGAHPFGPAHHLHPTIGHHDIIKASTALPPCEKLVIISCVSSPDCTSFSLPSFVISMHFSISVLLFSLVDFGDRIDTFGLFE